MAKSAEAAKAGATQHSPAQRAQSARSSGRLAVTLPTLVHVPERPEGDPMSAERLPTARQTVPLGGDVAMPILGLGVWLIDDGRPAQQAVGWALEAGYRHVDTAQGYGNERSVG